MRLCVKHPFKPNALEIDFNTVSIVFPSLLMGSVCGGFLWYYMPLLVQSIWGGVICLIALGIGLAYSVMHCKRDAVVLSNEEIAE